ncbi:helix-turn-helix domain-containing protein [Gorillibacterium sp. CAU 1737]|uniref:helix-turn-helix domain-containing protein n=1 Tax=Gorillibacterium sp. CAU 1737 TaxID=3140362 RepID=UPI003261AD40
MLDGQRLGVKINALRKKSGYSQEKLANMLAISPQAISKWENGHSLPETSLLPVLAQIFNCTIDDIIMPAYILDEKIELEKTSAEELQAERIADQILRKLGEAQMGKPLIGMDDESIVHAIRHTHPNIGNCEVIRGTPSKTDRYTSIHLTVVAPQTEIKLMEKIHSPGDKELYHYQVVAGYTRNVPQIFHMDMDKGVLLMEDLNEGYVHGNHFNEDNDSGAYVRENYHALLQATAKFHAAFMDNNDAFRQIGLDWRLESRENLLAHINGMEKDFQNYRTAEETGKIPKVWNSFENTIEWGKLDYFQIAIDRLRENYVGLIDSRFTPSKHLTVVHGDLHPGNMFLSKTSKTVKFIDMEAVRMGIGTEDLAMLLALHIAPNKKQALPLLQVYHNGLCETIKDYPFELLVSDYQLSIMEAMFYTIRLLNSGIYDFSMRDRAMEAFETFVLDKV